MKQFMVLLPFALLSLQCRHRIDYPGDKSAYNEKANESLEVRAKWMKYKGFKVDLSLQIQNSYKHLITLRNSDFVIEMDGDKGYLVSPRAATYEMEPGESIAREMIFQFDKERPRKGPVRLKIQKIVSGPIEKPGKELPPLSLDLPVTPN